MIKKNKNACCGCWACASICPKNCITMIDDEQGFFYPKVDEQKCVHCGKCVKVCPCEKGVQKDSKIPKAYAVYAKDDILRMKSSSGGVFTLVAEYILEQGGVVFGASFDECFMVVHKKIETIEQLNKLRGSKYLQSRIEKTYAEVKQELIAGKCVMYTGTACQIEGLKRYLSKEYDKLYTIDVLCHGVPSPKVWEKYLEEQKKINDSNIININCREKSEGWNNFSVKIDFENGTTYEKNFKEDAYMKMFLQNICLRPSCYQCMFKDINRISDITLGDCWGIKNSMPDMDDDKGTSVVLVHSNKGQSLFDAIKGRLVAKAGEVDVLLPPTSDSRQSVEKHPNTNIFWKAFLKGNDMAKLISLTRVSFIQRVIRKVKRYI